MAVYRLNEDTEQDLDRLYEYGILTFGLKLADYYYDGLISRFCEIAENPRLWQAVYHSHSIYYRIDAQGVEIMRILGQQDLKS